MNSLHYQSYLGAVAGVARDDYAAHRRAVESGEAIEVASKDGRVRMGLAPLPWDSDILGMPAMRVRDVFHAPGAAGDYAAWDQAARRLDAALRKAGAAFADARIRLGDYAALEAFEANGWRVKDVLNIYYAALAGRTLNETPREDQNAIMCAPIGPVEAAAVFSRCGRLFPEARMRNDHVIPPEVADAFYARLFESVTAREGGVAYGAAVDGQYAGAALYREDDGLRDLGFGLAYLWEIFVRPEYRGRGLGRRLLEAVLRDAARRHDAFEIGTQVSNLAANGLYCAAGMRLVANAITLHWRR
mgnify:CR=1 FL=1